MDYLVERMGLSVYDVLTFPAYFSYPIDTVIEPRTEFLSIRCMISSARTLSRDGNMVVFGTPSPCPCRAVSLSDGCPHLTVPLESGLAYDTPRQSMMRHSTAWCATERLVSR